MCIRDSLKARKVIEKAKGLLIETASLTEDEAFRFIQTTAMSERKTMLELAEKIISEGLRP